MDSTQKPDAASKRALRRQKPPLKGIKIIDFTHVQAGPACTQMLAWFGADVIKVERPGAGDVTRSQLRDIPNVDALYFTMLNSNKRSLTLDTKKPEGKEVLEKLIKESDVLVENFGPGALDRMGFTWERIQELNPKMIVASVKGFSRRPPLRRPEGLRERRAVRRRLGVDDRLVGRPADDQRRRARRQQHRHAPRDRHPDRADRPHADRQGPARRRVDAGQRHQPVPRQAARPAAPRPHRLPRGVSAVSARHVQRRRAARRQRRRRRPAGLDPEVQGLGDRPERVHLLHDPGPRVGADLQARSASRSGSTIRPTRPRRRASRTSWRSSPRSRIG